MDKIVIVGTGQAGVQAAISLRDEGYDGALTLVGEEPGWPYQRPPLSKAFLLGKTDEEGLLLRAPSFYSEYRIEFIESVRAEAIERPERWVRLSNGRTVDYDHLVLATGARQRPLPATGAELEGVLDLRTLQDAQALKARIADAKGAVVVGGGFIGLEFAAVARSQGVAVTVVEIAERVMARAVSPQMSAFFRRKHEEWGSDFRFGVGLREIRGSGAVSEVALGDGSFIDADLVLVGIGVMANIELAEAAGLEVGNGIVVDDLLRTSDHAISAIGDVALHPNRFSATGPLRLESVQNAADHARCVAARLTGDAKTYDGLPWFWSDQGPDKLQIAGLTTGYDHVVVRGDAGQGSFSAFCYKSGQLVGVESVNRASDHVFGRKILGLNRSIEPEQAADLSFDLKAALI